VPVLDREREICNGWARNQREITRVYFYGSRVWGAPRPDSDLDILVVAQPGAVIASSAEWTTELTCRLGVSAHLNDNFTADPELRKRILSSGMLVFSRYGDDGDFQFEADLGEIDVGS